MLTKVLTLIILQKIASDRDNFSEEECESENYNADLAGIYTL